MLHAVPVLRGFVGSQRDNHAQQKQRYNCNTGIFHVDVLMLGVARTLARMSEPSIKAQIILLASSRLATDEGTQLRQHDGRFR
jgi:hypothetical protein